VPQDIRIRLKESSDILLHYFPAHSALADWGKDLESHLSEWIVTHPDAYQEALAASFQAGCDFASTSTQAASPWRAAVFGMRHKVREHNMISARLARQVTPPDRYVAGFVSSTNPDFLEPVGNLKPQEVSDGYKEQISALLEGGVDVIMVVGNHVAEAAIAIRTAKDLADIAVIAQNVYYAGLQGFRSMVGHDPATGTRLLLEAGADVVGASCGLMKAEGASDPRSYYECAAALVEQMRAATGMPLSIQPNAGMAQLKDGKTVYPATPQEMARAAPLMLKAGARIIGGCCGTSLEHYRRLAAAIRGNGSRGARP
jgi:5-methyltetrahydrofolate--homocysteine methyltransferase